MEEIGIVADNNLDTVTFFDSEKNAILGTVSIPADLAVGDVLLLEDEPLGFVTNLNSQMFVIDLEAPTNPLIKETINISNFGEDLTFAEVDDQDLRSLPS